MASDSVAAKALEIGKAQAAEVLKFRAEALARRAKALSAHPKPVHLKIQAMTAEGAPTAEAAVMSTAGVLVAEGDSWFDYPFHDVLEELEDRHGYDVESVAHHSDRIEEMAYGGNQL